VAREADLGRRGRSEAASVEVEPRRHFIAESIAELRKVEWPNQTQVVQGSVVVIAACAIVGVYLWLNDQLWKPVVENLLLGQ
jgi:preprotein translocase SecE subunit